MFQKKSYLAVLVMLAFLGGQAQGAYLAAYWDGNYPTNWAAEPAPTDVRDALEAAGYEILDADQLKAWMDARIADGASSVVVFCRDIAPDTVVETNTADCTLRKYLDAGGKIVFYADIPFWNQGNPGGGTTNWGDAGATGILGFSASPSAGWDSGNTVTITDIGMEWGLTETWNSVRPATAGDVDIVLATDNAGNAAAWVKLYAEGDTTHGFVRLRDAGGMPNVEDLMRVAEYGLGPNPLARGPKPSNGSMIGQTGTLASWHAGDYAALHDVYFGESYEEVEAATPDDANVYVGRQVAAQLSMGTPGGPVPAGLVPGKTYYWRVDEINDAEPNSPWKGDVWSFWVQPLTAWGPSPADGPGFVRLDQDLTWEVGMGSLFHTVFFGETFEEVDTAVMGGWMTAVATYDPSPLEADKTYYWRVDEFSPTGTAKGEVWSFTTVPEIAVTDPTLLGWWTLNEGAGVTAVDWSGHGNHGSLRDDPEWIDGALRFDGKNDYVSVLLDVSEAEYAAAFWFKTTNGNCGLMAVVQDDLGGGGHDRHIYLTGGNIKIRLWDTEEIETAGLHLADGIWHHVVYTYGAAVGGQKLYVDGVLQASGIKDASDFDWQERINIGFSNDAVRNYFEGLLEDVRIYDKTLSEEEIQQVMRGNPLLAWTPEPRRGATVDIRDVTALRWLAGDTAVSHDVYFGTDRNAVAAADKNAAEYQGNQPGTSFSLAGLVEFGGGDYYWRIDEVEADGTTIHQGYTWKFTVPAYLLVEDFESYTDDIDAGEAVFQTWIDGWENGTGSTVGYWEAIGGTFGETSIVHGGGQSMPLDYNNVNSPYYSETERTFATAQNWTTNGVDTLTLHVRGQVTNDPVALYVGLEDSAGRIHVVDCPDETAVTSTKWFPCNIPLSEFSAAGVNLAAVKKMYIGLGNRDNPTPGGAGLIYIDDIRLTGPEPGQQ